MRHGEPVLAALPAVEPIDSDAVRGLLYRPLAASGKALVLTHGAGGDCRSPLLATVANAFRGAGGLVLCCDMAFRRRRPMGSPSSSGAAADRDSLRSAIAFLACLAPSPPLLGGHSYGGLQASILASESPEIAQGLLLLSYPLHPPHKSERRRTAHLPALRTPSLFVHGTSDPFGSIDEVRAEQSSILAPTRLLVIEGAAHDLLGSEFDWNEMAVLALA